ncbi:MAG: type 1 glutamine amidotransferase domain-containing protein [Cryomorphaceae bacterium]|nr:type 1 glutamine amidotransferase [Flavobacteriales bacterium]
MDILKEKKVAIIATHGFEESELTSPMNALKEKGATVHIISTEKGNIKSWKDGNWGKEIDVDMTTAEADQGDYDALVIPGGVINPDLLRRDEKAVNFVKAFFADGKPVSAICHGPQMLVEADVLKGRKITSFYSVRKDMENAGATWLDEEVVTDAGLVTSRTPADLDAFNAKMVEEILEGVHEEQTA